MLHLDLSELWLDLHASPTFELVVQAPATGECHMHGSRQVAASVGLGPDHRHFGPCIAANSSLAELAGMSRLR